MSVLSSIGSKLASGSVGSLLDGLGDFAKDVRAALTGGLSQEQRTELLKRAKDLEERRLEAQKELQQTQGEIIKAEAQGESWLQRNWRPCLMLVVILIIANNYIFFPYLHAFTDKVHILELPKGLWALLNVGVGGYVVGRSGEKIMKLKGKKK